MIAEGESSHNPVHENRLLTKASRIPAAVEERSAASGKLFPDRVRAGVSAAPGVSRDLDLWAACYGIDGLTAQQGWMDYRWTPTAAMIEAAWGWFCTAGISYWLGGIPQSNCQNPMEVAGAPMFQVNTGWVGYNPWILCRNWVGASVGAAIRRRSSGTRSACRRRAICPPSIISGQRGPATEFRRVVAGSAASSHQAHGAVRGPFTLDLLVIWRSAPPGWFGPRGESSTDVSGDIGPLVRAIEVKLVANLNRVDEHFLLPPETFASPDLLRRLCNAAGKDENGIVTDG